MSGPRTRINVLINGKKTLEVRELASKIKSTDQLNAFKEAANMIKNGTMISHNGRIIISSSNPTRAEILELKLILQQLSKNQQSHH